MDQGAGVFREVPVAGIDRFLSYFLVGVDDAGQE